jgi:hypothetical protein
MKQVLMVTGVLFFLVNGLQAQNPRLAMYEASPLVVNPAYAGKFDAKFRAGTHVSMMSWDSAKMMHNNVFLDFRSKYDKNDPPRSYWGVGLNFYRYGHATSAITAMFPSLSIAYHAAMDKRSRHTVDVGFQAAFASGTYKRLGTPEAPKIFNYQPEISGGGFTYRPDVDTPSTSHSYTDFSIGVNYNYKTNRFRFESGLAMYHLLYPENDILQFDKDKPKLRHRGVFNMSFGFDLDQSRTIYVKSMYWADGLFWLSTTNKDRGTDEYKVSAWAGVELHKNANKDYKKIKVNYGLHTRSFKTIMPLVSVLYNDKLNLRATYEYPMNSKNFVAYRAKRMEVALIYLLTPKSKVVPYTED